MAGRPNAQVEMRLVQEWLRATYPSNAWATHVRLGSMPLTINADALDDSAKRMVHGLFARWADAIVTLPDRTIVVEAKVVSHPNAIGQLMLYRRLLPYTPSYNTRPDLPIEALHLYARPDPLVLQMCDEARITCVRFDTPWIDEYLQLLDHRRRASPQPQRMTAAEVA